MQLALTPPHARSVNCQVTVKIKCKLAPCYIHTIEERAKVGYYPPSYMLTNRKMRCQQWWLGLAQLT
jgi:hypothetical protein